jgi:hypothetical protein
VDSESEDLGAVQELFVRKYGHNHQDVILKLVEAPQEQ